VQLVAFMSLLAGLGGPARARAEDHLNLPVVKPVISCDQLATQNFDSSVGAAVTITKSSLLTTEKGQFCVIEGNIAPTIGFEVE
jgi:hypothetical protein